MFTRRALLGGALASALVASARVPSPGPRRRFVFVINRGGWDPLTALAPMFGRAQIVMPGATEAASAHGLEYVASTLRPSVTRFFEGHGQRVALLHGLSVRSVAHEVCERTMMTGAATGDAADHATRLADIARPLPHLLLAGPSFPGAHVARVARAGETGQLQQLVDGSLRLRSDRATSGLSTPASRVVNDFVRRRARAARDARPGPGRAALVEALGRAEQLEDLRWDVDYTSDGTLTGQLEVSLEVLARGLAHCVTVSPLVSWDTHTDSDNQQSQLFESLFAGLDSFATRLNTTLGPSGAPLSEEVVVVVLSEMARTPQLNADLGRDHWPWTSALLWGPGVAGGRVLGAYDEGYRGVGVDAAGKLDPSRVGTSPLELAATLMTLADLDPGELGVAPISALLS